jgi:ATP-binding cassette subfamily C (CFTR/MRP) protein 1
MRNILTIIQASLALFTVLQAVILVLYAANSTVRTPTTLLAASLVLTDALGLCLLSHVEHVRSVKPSSIINTYLFFTLLFDIARTRTLWITKAPVPIAGVFTATTVVKFVVSITEAFEKRSILLPPFQHSSPETTSGIYSRSFFWWLNEIMRIGFSRDISEKDLFPIDDGMNSRVLREQARTSWNNANKSRSHALFWSMLYANRRQLALCIFPRLCLIGFKYAQPFLLTRTVEFVNSNDSNNIGWGLAGAFGLVFLGKAIASGSYYHMTFRFITALRGSLVSIIFSKTVDLSVISLHESAAITLMSNDTGQFIYRHVF